MAEQSTLARPYARAAFSWAQSQGLVGDWNEYLDRLARLSEVATVRDFIQAPRISADQRARVLLELAGDARPAGADNLVKLLCVNGRLAALPELAIEFSRLREEAESTLEATITTAVPIEQALADRITKVLEQRLGQKVDAQFDQRPEIIGGILVRVGDQVIDATIVSRLRRLTAAMTV